MITRSGFNDSIDKNIAGIGFCKDVTRIISGWWRAVRPAFWFVDRFLSSIHTAPWRPSAQVRSCSIGVDFTMPGFRNQHEWSQEQSTRPAMRLSSWVVILTKLTASTLRIGLAWFRSPISVSDAIRFWALPFGSVLLRMNSGFHDGHLPSHFGDSCPHCWQKNVVFAFAKGKIFGSKIIH